MNFGKPLVSIVIPTYNRAVELQAAIRSIEDQTYKNWELFVVDDGSKDRTCEIIEELSRKDPRIKLIRHEKNKGAQAARNTGIKAANGEWIAFLDSDDLWLPRSIELRLKLAEKENVPVVHSEAYILRLGQEKKIYGLPALSGWVHKQLLTGEGPMFQCLLVKKSALKQIGYLDESQPSWQEWETAIRLSKLFPFGFEPKPTFIYDYRTKGSISRGSLSGRGFERILWKNLKDIITETGFGTIWNHYASLAGYYKRRNAHFHFFRCQFVFVLGTCMYPGGIVRRIFSFCNNELARKLKE